VGSRLRIAHHWVVDQIYASALAAGFDDLSRSHVAVFRFPTSAGLRPTELAERLAITKQSVNDLLRDLEARGYVRLTVDPSDRRARIIQLTARGQQLEHHIYEAARAAEQQVASILGQRRFKEFRAALDDLVAHFAPAEE